MTPQTATAEESASSSRNNRGIVSLAARFEEYENDDAQDRDSGRKAGDHSPTVDRQADRLVRHEKHLPVAETAQLIQGNPKRGSSRSEIGDLRSLFTRGTKQDEVAWVRIPATIPTPEEQDS
jgi:hypothetical protein